MVVLTLASERFDQATGLLEVGGDQAPVKQNIKQLQILAGEVADTCRLPSSKSRPVGDVAHELRAGTGINGLDPTGVLRLAE